MAKENYSKELDEFRKLMDEKKGFEFIEDEGFLEWADEAENAFREVSGEIIKKLPPAIRKKGFVEAYFVVLARFICRFINKMERQGMFAKGKDGYGFFTNVLMPIVNEMVVAELDEDERAAEKVDSILEDLTNFDMSIDDILKKHFTGREAEWSEMRKTLEQGRQLAILRSKNGN